MFRFLRKKTNIFWLQDDIITSKKKQPVEMKFVTENVNNLKLEKQTCVNKILKCIKRKRETEREAIQRFKFQLKLYYST